MKFSLNILFIGVTLLVVRNGGVVLVRVLSFSVAVKFRRRQSANIVQNELIAKRDYGAANAISSVLVAPIKGTFTYFTMNNALYAVLWCCGV